MSGSWANSALKAASLWGTTVPLMHFSTKPACPRFGNAFRKAAITAWGFLRAIKEKKSNAKKNKKRSSGKLNFARGAGGGGFSSIATGIWTTFLPSFFSRA